MTRGNYQGWSYSPLDQINAWNVKGLTPVWAVSTGVDLATSRRRSSTTALCLSLPHTAR